jgi:hypothetical protein
MESISPVVVMSPRADVKSDLLRNHLIKVGPSRIEPQVIPALSWGTPGQAPRSSQWAINPPSTSTIVDRFVRVKCYLEVKCDGDAFQVGLNDALRQFPIASITDTITVQINGETVSQNSSDWIHALGSYGTSASERNKSLSTTASMPDQYQSYSDWSVYGSARNPLASYGENSTEQTRGGLDYKIAVDEKSFRVEITEPLFLSPFFSGHGNQPEGFVNINQMNITLRFGSNLRKIMSHSSLGGAIGNLDVSFYQAPEILLNYISPDLTQALPAVQTLGYSQFQEYIRPIGPVLAGASKTVLSDSIKLAMIPERLYLFCRHTRSGMTENTSDAYLAIDRVQVTWNNQSSLIGTASPEELFEMSSRGGLDMTYPQFRKYRGSVFCAQFGKDIGLLDSEAPGVQGQYTLSSQLEVTNTSTQDGDFEYFLIVQMGGQFSVFENGARASIGTLTQQMVLQARQSGERMEYHEAHRLSGGGFFDDLRKFVNKISRGVQSVSGVVGDIAGAIPLPIAQQIAGVARQVNSVAGGVRGATGGKFGGRVSGGSMSRRRM